MNYLKGLKNNQMPYYMDLHVMPGLTAEMVAKGHDQDLKVQDEFNCKCITYWVDVDHGRAFCLAEAPNKEALINTHIKAIGVAPLEVIEVNESVVKIFLGRVNDPKIFQIETFSNLKIFDDPAFRIILACNRKNTKLLEYKYGENKAVKLVSNYKKSVREIVETHGVEKSEEKSF